MLASIIASGLAVGAVYALIGVTYNTMFSASRVMSFTAGQLGMLGGVFGSLFVLRLGMPLVVGLVLMLALDMDGAPLTRPHGSPVRVVIPEMYGYKGVKWLTRIDLVPKLEEGFWEQRGYDVDAWVGRSNGY
jgi:hypothetical protein